MANGLNTSFQMDPERFLSSRKSIDCGKSQHGGSYTIDANGIANLDLFEYSRSQVAVREAVTGFSSYFQEAPLRTYYLKSEFDKTESMVLKNHSDYFLTDLITGCQFLAFGNSRHELTVCHVNALGRGSHVYDEEEAAVRQSMFPIRLVHGSGQYRAGLSAEDGPNSVVTIVGWRKSDGWHFYARQCVNSHNNKYVIGTAATELLSIR